MNLKEKFDLSKLSLDEIAKSIGKGKSKVCAVINGEYKSAKSELYQKAIENIIDEKISKNALNFDSGVWLSDMQKVIKREFL